MREQKLCDNCGSPVKMPRRGRPAALCVECKGHARRDEFGPLAVEKTCVFCGDRFSTTRTVQKIYCSRACQRKQVSATTAERYRLLRSLKQPKTCKRCGQTIAADHRNTDYCSRKCKRTSWPKPSPEQKQKHNERNKQWAKTERGKKIIAKKHREYAYKTKVNKRRRERRQSDPEFRAKELQRLRDMKQRRSAEKLALELLKVQSIIEEKTGERIGS